MSTYKINFGSGVTIKTEEEGGKVSSIRWEGPDADQIKSGINIELGMKVSGIVPVLEKFGWEFKEESPPPSSKKSSNK